MPGVAAADNVPSEPGAGANMAILDNFADRLSPQMITPLP